MKQVLEEWAQGSDISIRDESLSGHCHLTSTCATRLTLLDSTNGISLGDCPNELKREFWKVYAHHELFADVDAVLITYAIGLSELFMSFDVPMIIIVPIRYEVGRLSAEAWTRLNTNLRSIASDNRNTLAANNMYDLQYLRHFTGIQNVRYIPNFCGYTKHTYKPSRSHILIGPSRHSPGGQLLVSDENIGLLPTLESQREEFPDLEFATIRDLYPQYEFSDIAAHPAVVIIPYANSVMAVMEYYRMGIPLFAPSLDLLVSWQTDHLIMNEISWSCVYGACGNSSCIQPHSSSPHDSQYDPNNLTDVSSMRYWLNYSDFYQWPGVTYFDSWKDLFEKISSTNLDAVHAEMMKHNKLMYEYILGEWEDVFNRAFAKSKHRLADRKDLVSWKSAIKLRYPGVPDEMLGRC